MYTLFQPKISVAEEEADIQELIDEEYERRKQEKAMEEEMYKQMEEEYDIHFPSVLRINYWG